MAESGSLSAAFWLELTGMADGGDAPDRAQAHPTLEAELAAACARGRAAFARPEVNVDVGVEVEVDARAFVQHLARAIRSEDMDSHALSTLAIEDLYLTCACLSRNAAAAAELSARYGPKIRATIARIVHGADAGEIEQRLLDELLVGSARATPKLGRYAGKAPLDRWLGVAAQRAALMWLRENRIEARARRGAAAEPARGGTHPELAYIKERYRGDFEKALRESLARLPERERTLLRLHSVNGVSLQKIGKMFAVSQPTASRWLAAAREALLDDIKRTLRSRLGASSGELASLAAMVASRLDLSLSAILRTS